MSIKETFRKIALGERKGFSANRIFELITIQTY